ncbi:hypothetical protein JOM56_000781 [Amanita muscaria]
MVKSQKIIKRNTKAKDLFNKKYINPIIKAAVGASHKRNAEYTKNFIEGMWNNNKNFNYVLCNPAHIAAFDGEEGTDWAAGYPPSFNNRVYHLLIGGSGTFTRQGKGGYVNWAWKGSVQKGQDLHSNVIKFVKPGSGGTIESGGD